MTYLRAMAVLLALGMAGCDSANDDGFSGIARTTIEGRILDDDPDDWQPRCGSLADMTEVVCGVPAFPNPTSGPITIRYSLSRDAQVRIYVEAQPGVLLAELQNESRAPGLFQAVWEPVEESRPDGIYRIYIEARPASGAPPQTVFGDVRVDRPDSI